MIELFQFPWSRSASCSGAFWIRQRSVQAYQYSQPGPRLDLRLTRQRYYGVPIIRDGRTVVFETDDYSQVIAKYIDGKYQLDLFSQAFRGIDRILWRFIEDQIEGQCFRLNDIYWQEFVPKAGRLTFLRYKERKFGHGCLDQWRSHQDALIAELTQKLVPFEMMLAERPFLLHEQPHFKRHQFLGQFRDERILVGPPFVPGNRARISVPYIARRSAARLSARILARNVIKPETLAFDLVFDKAPQDAINPANACEKRSNWYFPSMYLAITWE